MVSDWARARYTKSQRERSITRRSRAALRARERLSRRWWSQEVLVDLIRVKLKGKKVRVCGGGESPSERQSDRSGTSRQMGSRTGKLLGAAMPEHAAPDSDYSPKEHDSRRIHVAKTAEGIAKSGAKIERVGAGCWSAVGR